MHLKGDKEGTETLPVVLHGDVTGAYVKAKLRGRRVFARLDKKLWYKRWLEQDRGGHPPEPFDALEIECR